MYNYNINPKSQIPKAIFLFIIRFIYLVFGLFFMYMERIANWTIGYNRKTEHIRKGSCRKCGKCCKLLAIQYPNCFNKWQWLIRQLIKWQEFHYGFKFENSEGNYLLYSCTLIKPDNTCSIYRMRPRLCREYPKVKLYGRPYAFIECGFYFVRRDGLPTFDEALHKASDKLNNKEY